MLQLSGTAWISFGIWMVIGIAVYFLYSRKHSALNNSKKRRRCCKFISEKIHSNSVRMDFFYLKNLHFSELIIR